MNKRLRVKLNRLRVNIKKKLGMYPPKTARISKHLFDMDAWDAEDLEQ